MTIDVKPLRNLVRCRLRPLPDQTGSIIRVSRFEAARWADVLAVGPECRDVGIGMGILINPLVGQIIGEDLLLPEASVLAYGDGLVPTAEYDTASALLHTIEDRGEMREAQRKRDADRADGLLPPPSTERYGLRDEES